MGRGRWGCKKHLEEGLMKLTPHLLCMIVAAVLFLIAAKPPSDIPVRWEWLAAAFVVLAFIF
jgi:hypothetical protein